MVGANVKDVDIDMISGKHTINLDWNTLWRTLLIGTHFLTAYALYGLIGAEDSDWIMINVMGLTFGGMGVITGWIFYFTEHDFHFKCTCDK
jgi:hypothetical protein